MKLVIWRLVHRGSVKRIIGLMYEETREDAVTYTATHAGRKATPTMSLSGIFWPTTLLMERHGRDTTSPYK
ncbi:Histone-fold containing protein [Trema orientale]|uniref:Histone-fold containing protein n=1 Tax=Trema orientale TaxID=63057 RepID=A0A2P5BZH6_TREOI|nr:Histone-fold containing protein [Trema orientale]